MKAKIILVSLAVAIVLVPLVLIAIRLTTPPILVGEFEVVRADAGSGLDDTNVTLRWHGGDNVYLRIITCEQPPHGGPYNDPITVDSDDVFTVKVSNHNAWLEIRYDGKRVYVFGDGTLRQGS